MRGIWVKQTELWRTRHEQKLEPDATGHGHEGRAYNHAHGADALSAAADRVADLVCGMMVGRATSKHRLEHARHIFHFCSARYRSKFEADPGEYLTPRTSETEPAPRSVIYTCPMHPQIRQAGPGNCPICGMVLEPLQAVPEAGPNPEF